MAEDVEGYRPYKHYRRKPLRRPRWHPLPRSSKYYRPKRYQSKEYRARRPANYGYQPPEEDFAERPNEDRPYTIVIQLPKKDEKYNPKTYNRNYEREFLPLYTRDDEDYIDEEDEVDDRMFQVDKKKVRIKVNKGENPGLHIKISRSDSAKDIEIVDKANLTSMEIPLESTDHTNFTLSMESNEEEWSSTDSAPTTLNIFEVR